MDQKKKIQTILTEFPMKIIWIQMPVQNVQGLCTRPPQTGTNGTPTVIFLISQQSRPEKKMKKTYKKESSK